MQLGWRRMRLCTKATASMAPAGGAVSARRAKRLANAATVYAGIRPDARKMSASLKNWALRQGTRTLTSAGGRRGGGVRCAGGRAG